ncbi:MAG TPA: hypothetical protein VHB23_08975 [Devosiaceae bacterium]|jgi:hypothetical protein|nr:hypothetical protein [Devosiaceae bacterium]
MKSSYRGFEIIVTGGDEWSAEIINPQTGKAWSQRPSNPIAEGSDACRKQAENLVDAFIALNGPIAA